MADYGNKINNGNENDIDKMIKFIRMIVIIKIISWILNFYFIFVTFYV